MIRPLSQPMTVVERAGLAAGLVLAAVLMWPLRGYLTDDTFIHLQYAKHLAGGQGLVFNVGERVYGCTSPLWVTLIADAMLLGIDGLKFARVLGFLSTLASVGLFLQLLRRTLRDPALRAIGTVVWAGHAWMIRWSLSGMETPLAVALVLAGFVAFTEGKQWGSRPVRTGALWTLAALTRPEAGLLLLLWGVALLIDTDNRDSLRRLVAGLLPPVAIFGAWLVFARVYFGTFWPQTLAAKTAGEGGLAYQLDSLWRQARVVGATDAALAAALGIALLVAVRWATWHRPPAQRFIPWAWLIGLPALYVARGVPVISRYLLPILPVLQWLAWRVVERWTLGGEEAPARRRRALVVAGAVAAAALAQNLVVYRTTVLPQVRSFTPGLEQSLVRWGRWLGAHTPEDAVIAAPDIGAIGYFSGRRVVDLAGLVTPEMLPYLSRGTQEEAIAAFAFASFSSPGYLVDRAPDAFDLLRRSPYAAALRPLGHAAVPNLGIARPGPAVYTFYRIDWAAFDSLRARRARAADTTETAPSAPRGRSG
jgi:hypothetical protein